MTIFYGLYSLFFGALVLRCVAAGLATIGERETLLWMAAAYVFFDSFGDALVGFLKAVNP